MAQVKTADSRSATPYWRVSDPAQEEQILRYLASYREHFSLYFYFAGYRGALDIFLMSLVDDLERTGRTELTPTEWKILGLAATVAEPIQRFDPMFAERWDADYPKGIPYAVSLSTGISLKVGLTPTQIAAYAKRYGVLGGIVVPTP